MDAGAKIEDIGILRGNGILLRRIRQDMQRVMGAVKLQRISARLGQRKAQPAPLPRKFYPLGQGPDHRPLKIAVRLYRNHGLPLHGEGDKARQLRLCNFPLVARPAPVDGRGGYPHLPQRRRLSVNQHAITCSQGFALWNRINMGCH